MASSCGKYPTLALTSFPCFTVSKPQIQIVPADGANTVTNAFISVVFPAPLCPNRPKTPLPTRKADIIKGGNAVLVFFSNVTNLNVCIHTLLHLTTIVDL